MLAGLSGINMTVPSCMANATFSGLSAMTASHEELLNFSRFPSRWIVFTLHYQNTKSVRNKTETTTYSSV